MAVNKSFVISFSRLLSQLSTFFQIRSAYFELVSALCQRIPQLMKDEASKVSPSVLLSIDDSDPVVCPALWEAVLYTPTTVEVS